MKVVSIKSSGARAHDNSERPVADSTALVQVVRQIATDQRLAAFDRSWHIAEAVEKELNLRGLFRRTPGSRLFYFSNSDRRLFDMEQRPFAQFLKRMTGLAARDQFLPFVQDRLRTAAEEAKSINVQTLSHYDPETGRLVVSDGGQGIWRRELGGKWMRGLNGEDDVFFLTDTDADAWEPEFSGNDTDWFLKQFGFANDVSRMDRWDQAQFFLLNLLHCFFPPLRKTRMIPAFLGIQGSGKSTGLRLLGRLLEGPRFEVSDIRSDRQDAFIAGVSNRIVYALDNVDAKIRWLPDALSIYATGVRYDKRRLHSINEVVSYEPRAMLIISSRDPHFTRCDVSERLLPLYCGRPAQFIPESSIFEELARRRGRIMGDILQRLAVIADRLARTRPKAVSFRMADFGSFIDRIAQARGIAGSEEEVSRWLKRLQLAQADFASDIDDMILILRCLFEAAGQIGPIAVPLLYKQCLEAAKVMRLTLPSTVQGFGQRLSSLKPAIELELNARFRESRGRARMRLIKITPIKDERNSQPSVDGGSGNFAG